ncbi:hypothetical protein L208DRAFT_1381110 [Tricholoma matsutake]|nr:hypothetical protein L208DRAFT_1381110 [Tricholoma matsutake 945]
MTAVNKGLQKATAVLMERSAKKVEASIKCEVGIKIMAMIWESSCGSNKMKQISTIRHSKVFAPAVPMKDTLEGLLSAIQEDFTKKLPQTLKLLTHCIPIWLIITWGMQGISRSEALNFGLSMSTKLLVITLVQSNVNGRGFTKQGVYARFNDQEYILTQHSDEMTQESEVKANLYAEYKLLAYCDSFKKEFDNFALKVNVNVPRPPDWTKLDAYH